MENAQVDFSRIGLYERMGERTTQPFALQVLDELGPLAGRSIIDVAAGTGGLAVVASERGASVLAIDLMPAMVERTGERLKALGNSRAEIMDFLALQVADASFDAAISNFGILAYPTWKDGLEEMVRVVKPGGRILLTMWTQQDDCSPAHVLHRVFRQLFPGRALWPPGLFPVFSRQLLEESLQEAGCTSVSVRETEAEWTPISSGDVVQECDPMFRSFPGYASLGDDEMLDLQDHLRRAFQGYASSDGTIRLPTRAFLVVATRQG